MTCKHQFLMLLIFPTNTGVHIHSPNFTALLLWRGTIWSTARHWWQRRYSIVEYSRVLVKELNHSITLVPIILCSAFWATGHVNSVGSKHRRWRERDLTINSVLLKVSDPGKRALQHLENSKSSSIIFLSGTSRGQLQPSGVKIDQSEVWAYSRMSNEWKFLHALVDKPQFSAVIRFLDIWQTPIRFSAFL